MTVDGRTLLYAAIGASVATLTTVVPGFALVGGGVAGFLEGGDPRDGAVVGLLAGVAVSALFLSSILAALGPEGLGIRWEQTVGAGGGRDEGLIGVEPTFFRDVVVAMVAYVVGQSLVLCPVGGAVGSYLADD